MSTPQSAPRPATTVVAAGRPVAEPGAGIVIPPTFTSTYVVGTDLRYARAGNPTWSAFEEVLGALEGGDALLYSSGMAAAGAALSLVPHGAAIVAPAGAYNGVDTVLRDGQASGRWSVRWVDVSDPGAVAAALPGAGMLWLESPTNPLLQVADLAAAARAAHHEAALVVVDNTFATPLLQRPLELGADIVLHSATKYLSGHSDVILGALVTRDPELHAALLSVRTLGGAIPGPMEAWLATRGIRTLAVRFDRACSNAAILAARLRDAPGVTRVRYPGFGAMISIELDGDADTTDAVCAAATVISNSTSLGGVETQWERRRAIPNEPATTPETLVRISVGIEDVEDIWTDLSRSLLAAGQPSAAGA